MSTNNFSGWTKKDFARWLRENHPKPKDRWVKLTLHIRHAPKHFSEITMADDYETCINELAGELAAAGLPEERCNIIIKGAKRRKEKQMRFYCPEG